MITAKLALAFVIVYFIALGMGILIGGLIEQIQWNKLIVEGKLPKPRNVRR